MDGGWTRLVLEKPFGSDTLVWRCLLLHLAKAWNEKSLYRIDRYLGKEVIDNLLVMRFANRLLTPIWNATTSRTCRSSTRNRSARSATTSTGTAS